MAYTLQAPVEHELLIKKSRFIARVQPVEDRAQAVTLVEGLRPGNTRGRPTSAGPCWRASKVAREPQLVRHCRMPYALEGWLRRELQAGQAPLIDELLQRLNEGGQGRLVWLDDEPYLGS